MLRLPGPLVAVLLLALSPAATAQVVYAGPADGDYFSAICPQVIDSLRRDAFDYRCATSAGVLDSLDRVIAQPADIGIGQLDVIAHYIARHLGQLAVVDADIAAQCLFAISRTALAPQFSQLPAATALALPPADSGSAASFRLLQSVAPRLARLRRIGYHGSIVDAVDAVRTGGADVAFFVQAADIDGSAFRIAAASGLHFIPVFDRAIADLEIARIPVYVPYQVRMTSNLSGDDTEVLRLRTLCTPVVLFTGLPRRFPYGSGRRDTQEALVKALSSTERPDSPTWRAIFRNMLELDQNDPDAPF